ncbi:MAG TPA: 3-hydroxyacyl-CoA dehydrogenase NAD-binding domain-containing protein [Fimbriimonadaceae bacterium]|nr:3-hydroxyacyl-CoA dehydrogenase NAD-binding domain-containing protein [Fimbriimonadaceae bacterium]
MGISNWKDANKVVVIGAGTMGSGIAAHLSNIGFSVSLLDLTDESVSAAFERARKARPPHFYTNDAADMVRLGSIEKNLDWVREADWVCEAIVEKLDLKQALFAQVEPLLRDDAMISTNTSGLQIELLAEGRSESFRKRFIGTHFFNPPRYLKLLELIPTSHSDPEVVQAMASFLEDRVARRVVVAKDTPGFIANRFGMWAMFHAIHSAEKLHLTVEQVDAITGPFLGRPRSGSFRLNDIVGLDIMQDIANNLISRCPHDPHLAALQTPKTMSFLLEKGWIGDKSGHGYYKKEGKELVSLDLNTFAYRERQDARIPSLEEVAKRPLGERVAAALDLRDEAGEFLRSHLVPVLQYANYLKEEISHNVQDFDRVMMWGFGWEMGPFAMIDAIGKERLGIADGPFYQSGDVRGFDGTYFKPKSEPQFRAIREYPMLQAGDGYNLRDLGDGVTAVSLTTKMGTINPALIESLTSLIEAGSLERFVLTGEARSFSAGFDLTFFAQKIEQQDWKGIDAGLQKLQNLALLLTQQKAVAATFGFTFGAGYELAASCPVVVARAEGTLGLPEAKVGLIPGGAGTVLMRLRAQDGGAKELCDRAIQLMQGTIGSNADDSRRLLYMRSTDITSYHPDRLLHDARLAALTVEPRPHPVWVPTIGPLIGMIDRAQDGLKAKGEISDHDELIGDKIKQVFSKPASLADALALEREVFVDLCQKSLTLARIKHMLETGKPLRN